MWEEILKTALGNGLWAVLFCVLLMYQLRDGKAREEKYRSTIDTLLGRLEVLDSVDKTVTETLAVVKSGAVKKQKQAAAACGKEVLRV